MGQGEVGHAPRIPSRTSLKALKNASVRSRSHQWLTLRVRAEGQEEARAKSIGVEVQIVSLIALHAARTRTAQTSSIDQAQPSQVAKRSEEVASA